MLDICIHATLRTHHFRTLTMHLNVSWRIESIQSQIIMACPSCHQWRTAHVLRRSFSMTAPVSRVSTPQLKKSNPNSAQVGAQMQARGEKKGVRIKKKAPQILSGSAPAPGHRKAERKRIVLSNTNALNVPNVRELTLEDLGNAASETSVLNIPGQVVDQLRSVGAFKPNQSWSWFSHPAFLMRRETTELAQSLEGKATVRKVVVGPRSSGKTAYLLQAMTMALMKGWVVISIPDGMCCLTGNPDYLHMDHG